MSNIRLALLLALLIVLTVVIHIEIDWVRDKKFRPGTARTDSLRYVIEKAEPKQSPAAFFPETNWPMGVPFPHGKRCSLNQSRHNAYNKHHASCPIQESFMPQIVNQLSTWRKSPITLVTIGCNKADTIVESMRQWSHNPEISTKAWFQGLKNHMTHGAAGGACKQYYHEDSQIDTSYPPRPVRAYCVEASGATFAVLENVSSTLNYGSLGLHVIHAAGGERITEVFFPKVVPGEERGAVTLVDSQAVEKVPMITVDHLVESNHLDVIDFLAIDTEGYDSPVLLGSLVTLVTKTVRLVEFEFHRYGRWNTARLQELIEYLDNAGFDCYWETRTDFLIRLTGCYHEVLDTSNFKKWLNVICANRRDTPVSELLESLASKAGYGADL